MILRIDPIKLTVLIVPDGEDEGERIEGLLSAIQRFETTNRCRAVATISDDESVAYDTPCLRFDIDAAGKE